MNERVFTEEASTEQIKATEALTNALLRASWAYSAIQSAQNRTPYVKYDESRAIKEFELPLSFKIDRMYFKYPKRAFIVYRQHLDDFEKDLTPRNIKSGGSTDARVEASKMQYNKEVEYVKKAAAALKSTLNEGVTADGTPYTYGTGDIVRNINPSCKHYGSMGIVQKLMQIPNGGIPLVVYKVTNVGKTYKPGDTLTKTADQLQSADNEEQA